MRQNFHYPMEENTASRQSLMEELRRTDEQLQLKRRQIQAKRLEEDRILYGRQPRKQDDQSRLRSEFYELPSQNQKNSNQQREDFLSKFSNNNDQQIKKEMYKKELDYQIEHKRQESVDKQKREQMAGDVWSKLMNSKPPTQQQGLLSVSKVQPGTQPPLEAPTPKYFSEKTKNVPKPNKAPQMVGVSEQEQRQQRLREQKQKRYYKELQQQIQQQKRRKQYEKQLVKQNRMDNFGTNFQQQARPHPTKSSKVEASKVATTVANTSNSNSSKFDMYEELLRGLKQKYKKGLIDLEEYETSVKGLQITYGKKEEQELKEYRGGIPNTDHNTIESIYDDQESPNVPLIKIQDNDITNRYNRDDRDIRASRQSQSLTAEPTQYRPVYTVPQPPPTQTYLSQNTVNQSIDPLHYANMMQQNQLQMFQKMMEGMKEIIATTLMYDRKRQPQENRQPSPRALPIQQQYSSIPRQLPLSRLGSPQLTKIHSPSPRYNLQPSLSLQNIKVAYESIDQSRNFFKKAPKLKAFKEFQYIQKMGRSTMQIPSTSCFVTATDGFSRLQKSFEKDLISMRQLQLNHQVEMIKSDKPYFRKSRPDVQTNSDQGFQVKVLRQQMPKPQSRKQLTQLELESPKVCQPQVRLPKKWERSDQKPIGEWKPQNEHLQVKKLADSRGKEQETLQRQEQRDVPKKPMSKKTSLEYQFQQAFVQKTQLPHFLQLQDIVNLRRQLKKEPQRQPQILQTSTYQAKSPAIVVNQSEDPEPFRIPQPRPSYRPQQIPDQYSGLHQFLAPSQGTGSKMSKPPSFKHVQEDSIDAQSHFEISRSLQKNSNVMGQSRRKDPKKPKDNLLFDFMSLTDDNKQFRMPQPNKESYEEVIENIPERSSNRLFVQQNQQSQTILSKFQESNNKPISQLNYSRQPSSITSLQEARKRAKQVRSRDKKQGSLLSFNTLEELQRQIRKKQSYQDPPIKKVPSVLKNPSQLLGQLDDLIDDEDEYPHDFDSYRQN